jgi:UDP-N-acetylmuramyl pentapeptide phosphotransferase/UDP-N-acetylglucosamine-1-phosphate transferase
VGGLVLMPAALAGWLVISGALAELAALAGVLSVMSYIDDRRGLPVALRFGAHLVAALAAVWLLMPLAPWWLSLMAVVAIAWLTNLYNFMDGADGLAGGMTVAGFGAYAFAAALGGAPALAIPALMVSAAAAGFLLLNFPPARAFMGDAGSVPLGFLAAVLGLAGMTQGVWSWWFPLLVFSPFIVDATVTLVRRAMRLEKIWQAHREHAYQRVIRSGRSHRQLLVFAWPLMLAVAGCALFFQYWAGAAGWPLLAVWAVVYALLFRWAERIGLPEKSNP